MESTAPDRGTRFRSRYNRGVRTSVRDNSAAYGYSVTITSSLAVIGIEVGRPTVAEVFLFIVGAVGAFTVVEAVASRGFTQRLRGEPSDVVAIGSALGFASAGGGAGAAVLAANLIDAGSAWPVGSFLATVVFLLVVGVELALAEGAVPIEDDGGGEESPGPGDATGGEATPDRGP